MLPCTYNSQFHSSISKLPVNYLGKTGIAVSSLSYGGSSLGGFYGSIERKEAIESLQLAIRSGINFIDTSPWYGESEEIIGEGIKEIPRDTYYIATKVGRNSTPSWDGRFDFTGSAILKSFERSLCLLGLDYVDLIQAHDIEFCRDPNLIINETIPTLESLVKAGKAKYIGITGYDLECLKQTAINAQPQRPLDAILSYARYNLHDTSLLEYTTFFEENGIGVINAAPLAMGLLTFSGPPNWHPASEQTKIAARQAVQVAIQNGTTIEDLSLGYSLRPLLESNIATTLVSMPTKDIVRTNLKIALSEITDTEKALYESFIHEFRKSRAGHWEGIETQEYIRWIKSQDLSNTQD